MLLIFQAMDEADKDGAIRHVMSGVNPQGCQVSASSIPARSSCNMTFSGAVPAIYPGAGASASLTVPTTKR